MVSVKNLVLSKTNVKNYYLEDRMNVLEMFIEIMIIVKIIAGKCIDTLPYADTTEKKFGEICGT